MGGYGAPTGRLCGGYGGARARGPRARGPRALGPKKIVQKLQKDVKINQEVIILKK